MHSTYIILSEPHQWILRYCNAKILQSTSERVCPPSLDDGCLRAATAVTMHFE